MRGSVQAFLYLSKNNQFHHVPADFIVDANAPDACIIRPKGSSKEISNDVD